MSNESIIRHLFFGGTRPAVDSTVRKIATVVAGEVLGKHLHVVMGRDELIQLLGETVMRAEACGIDIRIKAEASPEPERPRVELDEKCREGYIRPAGRPTGTTFSYTPSPHHTPLGATLREGEGMILHIDTRHHKLSKKRITDDGFDLYVEPLK